MKASDAEAALAFALAAAGLPEAEREWRFRGTTDDRRWRFDFAWPDRLLALEVDGGGYVQGRHSRGDGIEKDCEKMSEAAACGWRVLRVTPRMIRDGRAVVWAELALLAV